jgi:hypothetical protein
MACGQGALRRLAMVMSSEAGAAQGGSGWRSGVGTTERFMEPTAPILLGNNPRVARLILAGLALPVAIGFACVLGGWWFSRPIIAAVGAAVGLLAATNLVLRQSWWRTPRVSLASDAVVVYLRRGKPWRIPLEVVECFFLGQAPSTMRDAEGREVETRNVVIRLAERSVEWHQKPGSEPSLGRWCDGYITVYGSYCEPLDRAVVDRMNHQLAEWKRSLKNAQVSGTTAAGAKSGAASP